MSLGPKSKQSCKGACAVCCKNAGMKSVPKPKHAAEEEIGLVNPEGGLSSKGIQLLESIAGISKTQLKKKLNDTKRDLFQSLFEQLGIAYPITSRFRVQNQNVQQFRKRTEQRTRSLALVIEIQDQLKVLLSTYPDFVQIETNPSDSVGGEILLQLEGIRELKYLVQLSVRMSIPFDYPSVAPTLRLLEAKQKKRHQGKIDVLSEVLYQRRYKESAAEWVEAAQTKARMLAKNGENSLLEIVQMLSEKIEELEEKCLSFDIAAEEALKKMEVQRMEMIARLEASESQGTSSSGKRTESLDCTQTDTLFDQSMIGMVPQRSDDESKWANAKAEIVENVKRSKINEWQTVHSVQLGRSPEESQAISPESKKIKSSSSRYENDFEEEKILGRGAFGQVFKVRNNLDGNKYAVKRMVVNFGAAKTVSRILLEVQVLSSMNHPHIVRYHGAWTEDIPMEGFQSIRLEDAEDDYAGEEENSDADGLSRKVSDAIIEEDSNSQKMNDPKPKLQNSTFNTNTNNRNNPSQVPKKQRRESDSWSSDFGDDEDQPKKPARSESSSSSGSSRSSSHSSSSQSRSKDSESSSSETKSGKMKLKIDQLENADSVILKPSPSRKKVVFFDEKGNFCTKTDKPLTLSRDGHLSTQLRNSLTQHLQSRKFI